MVSKYVLDLYNPFKTLLTAVSIMFLFLVHLRLPSSLSAIEFIRYCHGNNILKSIRKFRKLNFKLCQGQNYSNVSAVSCGKYGEVQQIFLREELSNKEIKKLVSSVKKERLLNLKWISFHHVQNLTLVDNGQSISKNKKYSKQEVFQFL